jgi:hypothetical protein
MCALLLTVGVLILLTAYSPMDRLVRWLRGQSRIPEIRPEKDKGVPPWIVGSFERLLAFVLVLFDVQGAYTLLAIWIGAKLAASWHRIPVTSDEAGRDVRAGTMVALIAGIISVGIGVVVGLMARWACHRY